MIPHSHNNTLAVPSPYARVCLPINLAVSILYSNSDMSCYSLLGIWPAIDWTQLERLNLELHQQPENIDIDGYRNESVV